MLLGRIVFPLLFFCSVANAAVELDVDANGGVDVNKGGTNATTAAGARTNLGLVIGTNVQAYDANLPTWPAAVDATEVGYLNGVTSAIQTQINGKQNTLVSGTNIKTINSSSILGSGDLSITAAGDDLGAATSTDIIGLFASGSCSGYLKSDGSCDTPSGSMTYPGAGIAVSTGSAWGTSYSVTTLKNALDDETWVFANGISAPSFTSTASDGDRFLSAVNTVAITATATEGRIGYYNGRMRLADGTDWDGYFLEDTDAASFQAADADLTTYAGITPSANVQSLLGAADYSAMRTQLSLVPGTNVQAYDADLADLADGSLTASKVGNGYYVADDCTSVSSPATGAICDEY